MSKLRVWLRPPLVTNPLDGYLVRDLIAMLARLMGRHRRKGSLPVTLPKDVVLAAAGLADLSKLSEVQASFYLVKNFIHGTRAQDEVLLDFDDLVFKEASAEAGQGSSCSGSMTSGLVVSHFSTKNNIETGRRSCIPVSSPAMWQCRRSMATAVCRSQGITVTMKAGGRGSEDMARRSLRRRTRSRRATSTLPTCSSATATARWSASRPLTALPSDTTCADLYAAEDRRPILKQ